MTTLDKLDLLRTLARNNYSTWTRKALAENWEIVGDEPIYGVHKAELVEMTIEAELKEHITEPALTEGWANQVDYWLENMIGDMTLDEKAKYIASGLVREEWREAL